MPCQAGFQCVNGICSEPNAVCSASNCPGVDSACYCLNGQCIACGTGYTCSGGQFVPEVPINSCTSTQQCGPNFECVNGLCQQKVVECYASTDCTGGMQCTEGRCVLPTPAGDFNIVLLLIIIIAAILIPAILFVYIKRTL